MNRACRFAKPFVTRGAPVRGEVRETVRKPGYPPHMTPRFQADNPRARAGQSVPAANAPRHLSQDGKGPGRRTVLLAAVLTLSAAVPDLQPHSLHSSEAQDVPADTSHG